METRSDAWWRPPASEVALAVAFAAIGVSITTGVVEDDRVALAVTLTALHSGALVWRRRRPEVALAVLGATALAFRALGFPSVGLGPAALAGAHGLGTARTRRQAYPLLSAIVVVMAIVVRTNAKTDTVVVNAVALTVAWWLGDRQRRTAEQARRAEQSSDERARRAVADERLRIARELHDVVAHALSVIAVQAGTGRVVIDDDPATARTALEGIETQSRSALDEMRRLLHVLRADGDDGGDSLEPSPGVRDLDGLAAATTRSGLPVEVHSEGDAGPLPPGMDLTVFRIVQEALTNIRRHAGATRADVRLTWRPGSIDVEVVDDGHGADSPGGESAGNGIVGMRERVALYGGTLDVGNRSPRGFRVRAHLPLGDHS